jgi:uncharacterized protein (DUF1778 family)
MTKVRLSIRIPKSLKNRIRKAATLSGHKTLTDYVVNVINEKSVAVIDQHASAVAKSSSQS